jgi:hypothetical protein
LQRRTQAPTRLRARRVDASVRYLRLPRVSLWALARTARWRRLWLCASICLYFTHWGPAPRSRADMVARRTCSLSEPSSGCIQNATCGAGSCGAVGGTRAGLPYNLSFHGPWPTAPRAVADAVAPGDSPVGARVTLGLPRSRVWNSALAGAFRNPSAPTTLQAVLPTPRH